MTQIPTQGGRALIAQQRVGGVVVLRPQGAFDDVLAAEVRMRALEARAPVVVDLDGCESFQASSVAQLGSWQLVRPELCVVCAGSGDRWMMQTADGAPHVAVFATLDDALAARAVGGGWASE